MWCPGLWGWSPGLTRQRGGCGQSRSGPGGMAEDRKPGSHRALLLVSHHTSSPGASPVGSTLRLYPNLITSHLLCCYRTGSSLPPLSDGYFSSLLTGIPAIALSLWSLLNTTARVKLLASALDYATPCLLYTSDAADDWLVV